MTDRQIRHCERRGGRVRIDCLSLLPEGFISDILSLTSPRDACRSSAISREFKSAADSDVVWERFLPSDHGEILSRSASPPVFSTKKQLYFSLCDSPLILDGGKLSFALDKETGKKCYMLPAQELSIAWGDTPQYWTWISSPWSRFSEVALLGQVCWLHIWGKMRTGMLSPKTTYAGYLVYTFTDEERTGLESLPVKASVRFVGAREDEDCTRSVYLKLQELSRPLPREQNGGLPVKRKDGWMEIELGEFCNGEGDDDGEVEMHLKEIEYLNWKSGLIVEGIELRPTRGALASKN